MRKTHYPAGTLRLFDEIQWRGQWVAVVAIRAMLRSRPSPLLGIRIELTLRNGEKVRYWYGSEIARRQAGAS